MLRIRNLEAGYGRLRVLKNISMHVNPGEIVTIRLEQNTRDAVLATAISQIA